MLNTKFALIESKFRKFTTFEKFETQESQDLESLFIPDSVHGGPLDETITILFYLDSLQVYKLSF